MRRRAWRFPAHAPISVQLIGLLLAGLVIAQALSFIVIVLAPPPRPPVYRLSDVALALRGGSLQPRWGRPLKRQEAATLPADLRTPSRDREHLAGVLAAELGAPAASVRLVEYPSAEWRLAHWMHRHGPGDDGRGPPPPHENGAGPGGPAGANGPGGPPGDHGFAGPYGPHRPPRNFGVVGDFAAALQRRDGGWTVVRAAPETFPTTWQVRTSLWLLAGLLLVAPAGYLFARRITAPLKRFAEAAEALGRDPHGPLMTLSGPAEIGAAAQAFNDMQVRLRRYVDNRTAMVGAISHDLRTPLARIRFKVEAASPALRDSVLRDVGQMEQMIAAVLDFIRDEGKPRQREVFDLLSLLECVVDDAAMLSGAVELAEAAPVTIEGDPVGLRRLFENLIDNAVKYGVAARVSLRQEGDLAIVEVVDRGPGISAEDLACVFQPFFRTDRSRNLDNAGVGLGLPIALSTARAHGGDVELAASGEGTTATVTLPALRAAAPVAVRLARQG